MVISHNRLIILWKLVEMGRKVAYSVVFVFMLSIDALSGMNSCRQRDCDTIVAPGCIYEQVVPCTRVENRVVAPERQCPVPVAPEHKCVRWVKHDCPKDRKPPAGSPRTCGIK
jgi:hypothetical protein